jgi:flavorubredoxin
VQTGERISLGRNELVFIEAPMLHWPDSMFTYLGGHAILMPNDAFGQHYAADFRFSDQVNQEELYEEAIKYYANILTPFSPAVTRKIEEVLALKLPVSMIAPSHGVIWRTHGRQIVAAYRNWAAHRPEPKVLVIYDTMWESTAAMAQAILDGASLPGVTTRLIHIRRSNLTRIAAEVLDAAAVAFGSSTLNRGMMPMAAAALSYLEGLRPQNKVAVAFGSYGWGRGGPEAVDKSLRAMQWEVLREPLRARYRPTAETLEECRQIGRTLGERAKVLATAGQ